MERIGLFGGSFNPIHKGHLHLIQVAKEELSLDRVILIPAKVSPFKQQHPDMAEGADRLAMCRLGVESLPYCSVDDCELQREGVSFSVDTVRLFRERYPSAELVLLVGSDMFLSFHRWKSYQEILQLATLGVLAREEAIGEAMEQQRQFLLQYGKILFCTARVYTISSTKIRENLRNQKNATCYLPEKVVQYILSHQLYQ
jgi:nicotinate-nucleotide adenylyltransferase